MTNILFNLISIIVLLGVIIGIHELGHLMTVSIGHTEECWNNFRFLLKNAVKMGIYAPVDYSKKPIEYCSLNIDDNPYFDN